MTDINFGISPTPIEQSKSIYISSEKLSIKHHNYEDIVLSDFLTSLIDLPLERRMPKNIEKFSDKSNIHRVTHSHFEAKKDQRITVKHLFERLNFSITGFGLNPIIIVLNNKGYNTERPMFDGPFNDILPWNYSQVPRVLNHGKGFIIEAEDQPEESLSLAIDNYSNECCILDVRLKSHDGSPCTT